MDVIYSQSLLTIVALTSVDSRSALPGVRDGTRSSFIAKEFAFGRDVYALYPHLLEFSETGVYESRGWTFQERLLSKRCLFFTEFDMYYTCHSFVSCDTGINSNEAERTTFKNKFRNIFAKLDYTMDMNPSGGPRWTSTFCVYASLVHEYSNRKLSYDADAIDAFSGISAVLGHLLKSNSLCGLIECVLDACLLWVPGDNSSNGRNLNFPSWSWAGWRGEAFYLSGPLYDFTASYTTEQLLLMSLVEKFDSVSMSTPRPVLRLQQDDDRSTMVDGESKHATKAMDVLFFEATIVDIMQLNISSFAVIVRGNIYVAPFETHTRLIRVFRILDETQHTCGYLHYFPETNSQSTGTSKHRELVALSRSQYALPRTTAAGVVYDGARSEADNYKILFNHEKYKRSKWCLLNIMLIEWKGSEAERVTIGQMHIDAWNRLKTERKQIRLV